MRGCRILVVEDDLMQAFEIMNHLALAGHHVIGPAPDCDLALALADRDRPDIAFIDLGLRGGDRGEDLARVLGGRGIPIVFVTGRVHDAEMASGIAVASVLKPIASEAIDRSVAIARSASPQCGAI